MIAQLISDLHNLNITNDRIDDILDSDLLTFVRLNKKYLARLEPIIIMEKIYLKPVKKDNVNIKSDSIKDKEYLTKLFDDILVRSSEGIGIWFTDNSGNTFSGEQNWIIKKDFAKYFFEI